MLNISPKLTKSKKFTSISDLNSQSISKLNSQFKLTSLNSHSKLNSLNSHSKISDITIDNIKYRIGEKIGEGSYGTVFKVSSDSTLDDLVIKFIKDNSDSISIKESFMNEKSALKIVNQLVASDDTKMILIQKEIHGKLLSNVLMDINLMDDFATKTNQVLEIFENYKKLGPELANKFGLHHGDISPKNVIIDAHGKLHLIDYGLSKPVSKDNLMSELELDQKRAVETWNTSVQQIWRQPI